MKCVYWEYSGSEYWAKLIDCMYVVSGEILILIW